MLIVLLINKHQWKLFILKWKLGSLCGQLLWSPNAFSKGRDETVITIIYKLKESEKVKPRDEIIVIRENKKYIYAINPH